MTPTRADQYVSYERPVSIELVKATLEGDLALPAHPCGIVLFAHGSGSSRHSPRNRFVAETLQAHGIGTLLMDLLTASEEEIDRRTSLLRFNIRLLSKRLAGATTWALRQPELRGLSVGYFGASTGAAAALVAAAELSGKVAAVVSRGGRPDLAGDALGSVVAPTLLIVGGHDGPVIDLNEQALAALGCSQKKLIVIPGATHLFEEPGALEEVAKVAAEWFSRHFAFKSLAKTG
jgi:putative phosphoribosyl transferase